MIQFSRPATHRPSNGRPRACPSSINCPPGPSLQIELRFNLYSPYRSALPETGYERLVVDNFHLSLVGKALPRVGFPISIRSRLKEIAASSKKEYKYLYRCSGRRRWTPPGWIPFVSLKSCPRHGPSLQRRPLPLGYLPRYLAASQESRTASRLPVRTGSPHSTLLLPSHPHHLHQSRQHADKNKQLCRRPLRHMRRCGSSAGPWCARCIRQLEEARSERDGLQRVMHAT